MPTTYVVMRGNDPLCTADDLTVAQTAAIADYSEHLPDDREYRWDPTEWPVGTLVLKVRRGASRWTQAGYRVIPVPHTACRRHGSPTNRKATPVGIQTSARLIYGVPLPDHITDDELDPILNANPDLTDLGHAWAGTWSGGTRYLAAKYADADLGYPGAIATDELDPARTPGWNIQLRTAWAALGLPAEDMRAPGWILAANQS